MADAAIRIRWNEGTRGDWDAALARVRDPTLPQSFAYAQAMAKTHGYLPGLGRIERAGEDLGLVQILERRTLRVLVQRQLHRGPLWFGAAPSGSDLDAVLAALRRAAPSNLLSRLSFLPELGVETQAALERAGFRRIGPGYRTVWLDLSAGAEAVRAGFSPTWRQRLRTAEKAGLTVATDSKAQNLPWLMEREAEQAAAKHFRPLPGRLAVRLRNAFLPQGGVFTVTASDAEGPVAAALFLRHGRAATYQVGWSGERGRRTHAMRLVLWTAVLELCRRGVERFDLGGINPETAAGVTEFKLGMGGRASETAGLYR